tara:strand:+ start:612 stop:1364 length:753 start_codon:yes stop_codon:yes gene_type:complete
MNGIILYDGKSQLDNESDIVVILTGLEDVSSNKKTGNMLQTWILDKNTAPHEAIKTGADKSVCGDCKHRGLWNGKKWIEKRTCYVKTFQAPLAVWKKHTVETKLGIWTKAYTKNPYGKPTALKARELVKGRVLRIGSYGDPLAVPQAIWNNLLQTVKAHTGYTHQWQNKKILADGWNKIVMASVESREEAKQATAQNYRYFRVMRENATDKNEILCPASKEAGVKSECAKCKLCAGTSSKSFKSIAIVQH